MAKKKTDLNPYKVEVEEQGACKKCGAGTSYYVIYGPDNLLVSSETEDGTDAECLAYDLNRAFLRGYEEGRKNG